MCFFITDTLGLRDVQTVEILQDHAHVFMGEYVRHTYPRQPTRFGRLLLAVPCLRAISSQVLEKLFFHETVGTVSMERLVCDIYQGEKM